MCSTQWRIIQPFFVDFYNRALCYWSSETAEMEGPVTFLRNILSVPPHSQAETTCSQNSQGIFAFQVTFCAQRGKARNKYINGCLHVEWWPANKVLKGREQQNWDRGWLQVQNQCNSQRASSMPGLATTTRLKLLRNMDKFLFNKR